MQKGPTNEEGGRGFLNCVRTTPMLPCALVTCGEDERFKDLHAVTDQLLLVTKVCGWPLLAGVHSWFVWHQALWLLASCALTQSMPTVGPDHSGGAVCAAAARGLPCPR